MAKTKQFTIAVDNQPGAIAGIAKTLGNAKVNILSLLGTVQGTAGTVQLIVDDARRAKKAPTPRRGSKTAKVLALLKRPGGVSLQQLQKATGWQPHSVRGFLSGALKKNLGLRIDSAKDDDGERTYRLASK